MYSPSNNGQRSLERVAALCGNFYNTICSAAEYAAAAYVFKPATIATMELTSAQTLLISLLYSLVFGDRMFCCILAGVCSSFQQLHSSHLKVWLVDDFEFPRQDIRKGLSLLSELLSSGTLHLPNHVVKILSSLTIKYQVHGLQFPSFSQEETDSLESRLEKAVVDNSPADIISLAIAGGDVNCRTQSGDSLIHLAVSSNSFESITALGYLKANLEVRDSAMVTPLQKAVQDDNYRAVRMLVLSGVDTARKVYRGDSMLHLAAARRCNEALQALLEGRVEVDEKNNFGETALMQAIRADNDIGVKLLLKKGADFNTLIKEKRILEIALESQNIEIVRALIKSGAQTDDVTESGDTSLHLAIRSRNVEIVKAFLDCNVTLNVKNKDGLMPLHVTSSSTIVRMLLAAGATVDSMTSKDQTLLHIVSGEGYLEMIKTLVQEGASVDLKDSEGRTALSIAAANSKADVVALLLHEAANVNCIDQKGWSPLHYAAKAGCIECVLKLLDAGAEVDVKNNIGETPAFVASRNNQLPVIKALVQHGADQTTENNKGNTMLHIAAFLGHSSIVLWLLDAGIEIALKGDFDHTALFAAAQGGHYRVVLMLLDRGLDINSKTTNGETALYTASDKGHLDVVRLLVERGASINDKIKNSLTVASSNNHTEVANFLKSKGATN